MVCALDPRAARMLAPRLKPPRRAWTAGRSRSRRFRHARTKEYCPDVGTIPRQQPAITRQTACRAPASRRPHESAESDLTDQDDSEDVPRMNPPTSLIRPRHHTPAPRGMSCPAVLINLAFFKWMNCGIGISTLLSMFAGVTPNEAMPVLKVSARSGNFSNPSERAIASPSKYVLWLTSCPDTSMPLTCNVIPNSMGELRTRLTRY